jgi:micrococcal nuclease
MYEYNAVLDRVVDGDTVDLIVDLGFRIKAHYRFRLLGIDAPEPRGATKTEGLAAKAWLEEALEGKDLIVHSEKSEKYGRWLAKIWTDPDADDISGPMISAGHAIRS